MNPDLPDLWPHQSRGVSGVIDAIARGAKTILLTSPTGGGKTRILQEILVDRLDRGESVVLYTNRNLLREQISRVFSAWGIEHGIRASGEACELDLPVQISSIQTDARRVFGTARKNAVWDHHRANLVVTDECFVGGTEVLGSCGPVRIDNVKPGDMVHTAHGLGVVEAVSCRPASRTVILEYDNGFAIECTENHPVFTGIGWVAAGSLEVGSFAYGPEGVFGLWRDFWSKDMDQPGRVQGGSKRNPLESANILLKILLEEVEQPDEQTGKRPKGQQDAEKNRPQTDFQRRQRATSELVSACHLARSWIPLGGRVLDCDVQAYGDRFPDSVQGRHRKPGIENSHRDRRGDTQFAKGESGRRKENCGPGRTRLVCVSRIKRESVVPVFNLQVGGHPSYFANGILVHNCHMNQGDKIAQLKERHKADGAVLLDITATPLDLVESYDEIVQAGTTSELRECGALLWARHVAINEPDRHKVRANKVGELEIEPGKYRDVWVHSIVGTVIDNYRRLNPDGRPTCLFAPGVKESVWFAEQMTAAGHRWAHIDGNRVWVDGEMHTGKSVRDEVITELRKGAIKGVSNRFVLREGIDIPELYLGIFATVFGSLKSYLQSGGRILRAHPGMENVVIQDHGGNWWRHGSLNDDRVWVPGQTGRITNGLREEGVRSGEIKLPIACPKCGQLRMGGARCSNCATVMTCPSCGAPRTGENVCGGCGQKLESMRSRQVVQENGELHEVTGSPLPPRRVRLEPDTQSIWERCYFRAKRSKSGLTFRQAEALFVVENGYWPPRDLPRMPKHLGDWFAKVRDVPAGDLL